MNALFFTQSSTLKVYYDVLQSIQQRHAVDKVGFYISDSLYYGKFLRNHGKFESGDYVLLKEWVVSAQAEKHPLDIEKLRDYEQKLGVPNLWNALISDRRILNGANFSYRQNYTPRFSHDEMLKILLENLIRVEKLFDEIQPTFTSCFICTTIAEYLCFLFSRARGIPFLNLRPTRIYNYMMYGQSVYEPSEFVRASYERYSSGRKRDEWIDKAEEYVEFSREKHAKYEGVFLTTQKPPQVGKFPRLLQMFSPSMLAKVHEIVRDEISYRFSAKFDRRAPGTIKPLLYRCALNPRLVKRVDKYLAKKYVSSSALWELDYVFFPLHKEPEVTLLVYSKPYLNQIEVIRNVALSLPAGRLLLVKEHPASVGTRPVKYYKKLLEIPNVRLVDTSIEPRALIQHAKMVVNIAGSVGFEALLLQKPVLIFGKTPYEMLPASMVRKVTDLNELAETISDLTENHQHDEPALINYIAATIKESVPLEFYTKLLGRVEQFSTEADSDRDEMVERLAEYTLSMVKKAQKFMNVVSPKVQIVRDAVHDNGRNGHKKNTATDEHKK